MSPGCILSSGYSRFLWQRIFALCSCLNIVMFSVLFFFYFVNDVHYLTEYLDCIRCMFSIIGKTKSIVKIKITAAVLSHAYAMKIKMFGSGI